MFTRCPACQTLFRVRPETLRIALGQVRCGRCDTQFNALETLAEDAEALVEPLAAPVTGESPVVTEAAAVTGAADMPASAALGTPREATASAPAQTPPPALSPETLQALLLQDERPAAGRGWHWAWAGAAGALLILLAGQWAYLQRAHWYTAYPSLRPALEAACTTLGCVLPLTRAPERIEVLERLVRAHPRVADALLVEVTFVSRADVPIAYPLLELQLTDVSGNRAAARRFTPAEYLPEHADIVRGLAPEKPQQVTLELVAPRTEVVSFQFDFL